MKFDIGIGDSFIKHLATYRTLHCTGPFVDFWPQM